MLIWRSRDNHEGVDYLIMGAADADAARDALLTDALGVESSEAHPDELVDFEPPQGVVHWWEIVPLFEPAVPDRIGEWSCVPLLALDLTGKLPEPEGTRGVCFDGEHVAIEHYNIVGPFDDALDGAMHGWDWCVDLEHGQGLAWALARVGAAVDGGPVYRMVREAVLSHAFGLADQPDLLTVAVALFEREGGVVLRVEPQQRPGLVRTITSTQDGSQPRQEPQKPPQAAQDASQAQELPHEPTGAPQGSQVPLLPPVMEPVLREAAGLLEGGDPPGTSRELDEYARALAELLVRLAGLDCAFGGDMLRLLWQHAGFDPS